MGHLVSKKCHSSIKYISDPDIQINVVSPVDDNKNKNSDLVLRIISVHFPRCLANNYAFRSCANHVGAMSGKSPEMSVRPRMLAANCVFCTFRRIPEC